MLEKFVIINLAQVTWLEVYINYFEYHGKKKKNFEKTRFDEMLTSRNIRNLGSISYSLISAKAAHFRIMTKILCFWHVMILRHPEVGEKRITELGGNWKGPLLYSFGSKPRSLLRSTTVLTCCGYLVDPATHATKFLLARETRILIWFTSSLRCVLVYGILELEQFLCKIIWIIFMLIHAFYWHFPWTMSILHSTCWLFAFHSCLIKWQHFIR